MENEVKRSIIIGASPINNISWINIEFILNCEYIKSRVNLYI